MPDNARRAVHLLNQGVFQMDDIITHRFPLAEVQTAMETLEHKPTGFLKGAIMP